MCFTVRRMMIAVAAVAVAVACAVAVYAHPALGGGFFGVSSLSLVRTFEAIDRSEGRGTPLRPVEVARSFLASTLVALSILVASLLPSFCIFPAINRPRMHETPRVRPVDLVGIGVAALLGVSITSLLRRRIW